MPTIYRAGKKIDHYEIMQTLGQGVASQVYLARDLVTQQQVVLKFPIDDIVGGAAIYTRFQREKAIGKRLSHPAIQRHLNLTEERSQDYMVLEYLEGQNLRAIMQQHVPAPLSATRVVHLLIPVCEALIYAHTQGVIHRDIKPDNIMLLDSGEVKIIDFGIALLDEKRRRPLFGSSQLIGTPNYMSPERLRSENGDIRTDVYGVGVTLYELISGRTPFQEDDGFEFVSAHFACDPPDILEFAPTLEPELATVIMRTIRCAADQRYQSMADLLADLQQLDTVTPVPYIPTPPRFGGRYSQVLRIALIVLVVIILVIAFGLLAQLAHPLPGHR